MCCSCLADFRCSRKGPSPYRPGAVSASKDSEASNLYCFGIDSVAGLNGTCGSFRLDRILLVTRSECSKAVQYTTVAGRNVTTQLAHFKAVDRYNLRVCTSTACTACMGEFLHHELAISCMSRHCMSHSRCLCCTWYTSASVMCLCVCVARRLTTGRPCLAQSQH